MEVKKIDITNQEAIRKLTREDLMSDAIARNDKAALRWLEDEFFKEVPCKDKDGKETGDFKPNPLISVRAEYLRKFCGYTPKDSKAHNASSKAKAKAEREAALRKQFEDAFRQINANS